MLGWSTYDLDPPYQRQSAAWSKDREELFIDTLFSSFDVPKIYFEELPSDGPKSFAVIDGKQRLSTIRKFFESKIRAPKGFVPPIRKLTPKEKFPDRALYSELPDSWKEFFKAINLDVVFIKKESPEEEIEDLFARLNNGAPLNAAENRNAITGKWTEAIRSMVATDSFFFDPKYSQPHTSPCLPFGNKRMVYNEIATRLLLAQSNACNPEMPLTGGPLDKFVESGKSVDQETVDKIVSATKENLRKLEKVFGKSRNEHLSKSLVHVYYIFVDKVTRRYGHLKLYTFIGEFISQFEEDRAREMMKDEDSVDKDFALFTQHVQQNTGNPGNLSPLVDILVKSFLKYKPDVSLKDPTRAFTDVERYAIWNAGGKKCASCGVALALSEMAADHVVQWAAAGVTSLKNSRCLCVGCNSKLAKKVE